MSHQPDVHDYGPDIYTEAEGADDTLENLGPLRALAGSGPAAKERMFIR